MQGASVQVENGLETKVLPYLMICASVVSEVFADTMMNAGAGVRRLDRLGDRVDRHRGRNSVE